MSTLLEERNVENAILKIYKKWEKLKKKKKKSSGGWYITSKITFSIYKKNQIKDKNNRL